MNLQTGKNKVFYGGPCILGWGKPKILLRLVDSFCETTQNAQKPNLSKFWQENLRTF